MERTRDPELAQDIRLRAALVGLTVGAVGMVVADVLELLGREGTWERGVSIVALGGWLVVAGAVISAKFAAPSGARHLLTGSVDDERVRDIRREAFSFALGAVLLVQMLLVVGAPRVAEYAGLALPASFAAHLTIATAAVASVGRFVARNR